MKDFKIHTLGLFALSAVLSGGFASCAKIDPVEIGNQQQIVVGLGDQTRSHPIEGASDINTEKFGFLAWHVKPSDSPAGYLSTYGKVVHFESTFYGADLYNGSNPATYYWPTVSDPSGHSLKFLAWYPYEGTGVPTNVMPDEANQSVEMNFAVQENAANQIDLLAATHEPGWGSDVKLNFHHALTRLQFRFRKKEENDLDYKVSKIELKNVANTGSLTVSGGGIDGKTPAFTWDNSPGTGNIFWQAASGQEIGVYSWINYASMEMNETFMTIPMDDASEVEIELTLDINSEKVVKTVKISDFTAAVWGTGEYIEYRFTISEVLTIELEAIVRDWHQIDQKVIFDGQYFLGVSEDEPIIRGEGGSMELIAQTDYDPNPGQDFPAGIQINAAEIQYVSGGTEWLSLANIEGENGSMNRIVEIEAEENESEVARTAKVYVRAGNMTKVVNVYQIQKPKHPEVPDENILSAKTYVGAFWRADQTGERLIRIKVETPESDGKWAVQVYDYGEDFQPGDIVFSTEMSNDRDIGWRTDTAPNEEWTADMNNPFYDSQYQVWGDSTYVTGNTKGNDYLFFRIGLKSTWTPTTTKPARYAVIVLSYNNNTKFQKLWLRQGHDPDYLMNIGDPSSKPEVDVNGRQLPVRFSPYNLTSPKYRDHSSSAESEPVPSEGKHTPAEDYFTNYPTQAGAFYQFSPSYRVLAFHPSNPIGTPNGWQVNYKQTFWKDLANSMETCPAGYRRPTDGNAINDAEIPIANITPANSEIGQSLFWDPPAKDVNNKNNSNWGYYADGFFDRRKITEQPFESGSQDSEFAVAIKTVDVAYNGRLCYNPYNNASLFFPAAGFRNLNSSGILQRTDKAGYYWTASAQSNNGGYVFQLLGDYATRSPGSRTYGYSIRCVKEDTQVAAR